MDGADAVTSESVPVEARLERFDGEAAADRANAIWDCYRAIFPGFADVAAWRAEMFDRHRRRERFRVIVATIAEEVVGFSWGYVGRRGQYWSDLAYAALPRPIADEWIGGHFEFVELGVLPAQRRHGLGRRLHDALLADVHGRCVLSTADDDADPAVLLYRSVGWRRLGVLSPGTQVMALERS